MMNKSRQILIAASIAFFCLNATAQTTADSVSFVYSIWNAEQRKAILQHMNLTEPEKAAFLPAYDTYSRVVSVLEVERLQLLDQYGRSARLPDENETLKLFAGLLQNDLELAKVRMYYYRKFRKVLSCSRANEFMSLDQSMRTLFHLEVQRNDAATALSEAAIYSLNARQGRRLD